MIETVSSSEYHLLAVMDATSGVSSGARMVLLCIVVLLLLILVFLIAFAVLIRPRSARGATGARPARPAARPSGGGRTAVAVGADGLAVASSDRVACPTCRHHYEPQLEFCPRDARRLVRANRLDGRSAGNVCVACRRAFDAGTRYCPHDGAELVASAVYDATRREVDDAEPTGVIGKICPQCRSRHDLAASFCGRDGAELVPIN